MNKKPPKSNNLIDFSSARSIKELVTTANDRIGNLEHALYSILDCDRIDVARELAADALEEDLDAYLEDEVPELDFENDDYNWSSHETNDE